MAIHSRPRHSRCSLSGHIRPIWPFDEHSEICSSNRRMEWTGHLTFAHCGICHSRGTESPVKYCVELSGWSMDDVLSRRAISFRQANENSVNLNRCSLLVYAWTKLENTWTEWYNGVWIGRRQAKVCALFSLFRRKNTVAIARTFF